MGFGKSAALKTPFSVGDYAAWLNETTALLRLRKPHVVAHSFGCRVAVKSAALYPDLFDKMVLTGPAGVVEKRGVKYRVKVGAYRFVKKFAPAFAERNFGSAEYRALSPIMKESYKKIVNEDLRESAKRVKNSVLLVEGSNDSVTTRDEVEIYLQSFPWARLEMIDGGHFAFAENPVTFNLIAEEFLYG